MFYIRPNVKHDVAKKFYLVNTTAHHLGQYISLINLQKQPVTLKNVYLDQIICFQINWGGSFVQNQNPGLPEASSGKAYKLSLAHT